jgi:hypothetical protein
MNLKLSARWRSTASPRARSGTIARRRSLRRLRGPAPGGPAGALRSARYGSLGASYETYCLVAEQIAQGNGPTALTCHMHCQTMNVDTPRTCRASHPSWEAERAQGQGQTRPEEVTGQVVGEAGPGLWIRVQRVLLPNGDAMPLHAEPVYFLRWELVTTARLYDALPADIRRIG